MLQQPGPLKGQAATRGSVDTQQQEQQQHQHQQQLQAGWSASNCMPGPNHTADGWSATYSAAPRMKPPGLEADVLRANMLR